MARKPISKPATLQSAKVATRTPAVPKPVAKAAVPAPVVKAAAAKASPVAAKPKIVTPAAAPVAAPKTVTTPKTTEGKSVMNDTVTKVQETAQKFTADATERATAMFGDMNTRAKSAMEKGTKAVEEMVELSKGNVEAIVASGRVAAKGAEEIAKYTADYGRKAIEEANANAKKFAAVKSPTEFFALQSELAKTSLDALVGEASKFSESYLKLIGEIVQPLQNRYAVAAEKVKSAVAA